MGIAARLAMGIAKPNPAMGKAGSGPSKGTPGLAVGCGSSLGTLGLALGYKGIGNPPGPDSDRT